MAYVVALAILAALVGLHELVLRVAAKRFRRKVVIVALAGVASYLAIAALAFAFFETRGMATGRRFYVVDDVLDDYDAKGKLEPGDRIVAVYDQPVFPYQGKTLTERVNDAGGGPVRLTIERDGKPLDITIQPRRGQDGWLLGIKKVDQAELVFDHLHAVRSGLVFALARTIQLVQQLVPKHEADPGGPARIVDEFRAAYLPDWVMAAQKMLSAASVLLLVQIVVNIVRLRRRK